MPFPHKLLHEDEEVLLDVRPHWWRLAGPFALAVVVLGGCIAAFVLWSSAPGWFGFVLLAAVVLVALYLFGRVISWRATGLAVTSSRVIYRQGVLHRVGREIPIDSVQDVTYRQHLLERMVGAGRLTVESAGERGEEPFADVRHPEEVQSAINRAIEESRQRNALLASGQPAMSVPEQIERLDELRRRGVVTDDEFEQKKAELLGRM
jgi:uncharacterized membrane protein YdbT with pleckstrin-like domain